MTRIADLEDENLTAEQKRIAEEIAAVRGGYVRGPFAIWMRIPEIADTANKLGNALRLHGKLDRRLFELTVAMVARHWSAQYEWYAHKRRGLEAGLSPDIYEAIRTGHVPNLAGEKERIVYEIVKELLQTRSLCQCSYELGVKTLGSEGLIELITDVGFYTMIAMVLNSFDVSVPEELRTDKELLF